MIGQTVTPAKPVRVLVVDDSTFMRGALVRMISKDPRFTVIDTAANGKEGWEKAMLLKPDVMTMDVEMPVMNGLEALAEIMKTVKTPVIMISTLTEAGADTTIKALELGAVDFVPKAFGDKERNIFRGAEELYEKLLAAAGVDAGGAAPVVQPLSYSTGLPVRPAAPVAPPAPLMAGLRVNARLVMIGSSTGGPKALQTLIEQLPANLPVPVVIAQHMPPQFTLALAKRLNEICRIKVVELANNMLLEAGTVYISPGGLHARVSLTSGKVMEDKGESLYKPSVDVLAESVGQTYGKNVIAVMLTGMGSDGMKEYIKLKELGAHVIAQDKDSCVVYGMPKAVVEAGAASEVLPLEQIGRRVASLLGV
ncbi:MAG: chemotaxis response regulator protein-glutamate methylesterase [Pseudomonas fluorescens]|nr:MAG: chemotaxis response regulator protein-glutamate methylesterase [Pseudomonas fluorescens]